MPQIRIIKKHSLGREQARRMAERLAAKLASEYNAKFRWNKDNLEFDSRGVNGLLHVSQDEVEIKVDLGLMLRPFRARIENGIMVELDDFLRGDETPA